MKLFDRVRAALRTRHYSIRTEEAYVGWIRRFVVFYGKRHPDEMGEAEINAFVSDLATRGRVAASTQTQALSALLFLYREVLGRPVESLGAVVRAKRPERLPVVLTRDEVRAVLARLDGTPLLVATLLYGTGLRLMECLRLRVKDVDFALNQIIVRDGKGMKDRLTMLPVALPAAAPAPPGGRQSPPRGRPPRGLRQRLSARRPRAEVSGRGQVVGLAVDLPRRVAQRRPASGRRLSPAPPPSGRNARPTRRPARRARGPPRKARKLPHPAAFLRHAPPRERLGHPHHPGAPRPPRRRHHHDLYTRPEPRRPRRHQPAGPDVSSSSGVVGSCLKPGRKGTRKLLREFGPRLVCVRYRYDERKRTRTKTVEHPPAETSPGTPS